MRTRTFRGESVQAIMQQVRDELGGQGLILNTLRKEESVIEIEVELVSLDSDGRATEAEEPSLSDTADLARDTDAASALVLNNYDCEADRPYPGRVRHHYRCHPRRPEPECSGDEP